MLLICLGLIFLFAECKNRILHTIRKPSFGIEYSFSNDRVCSRQTSFAIFCSSNGQEDDSYVRSKSYEQIRNDYVEKTRQSVQKVIRSSWNTVKQLGRELPPGILQNCEEELRKATSLLVLATVRRCIYKVHMNIHCLSSFILRCADLYPESSKAIVQQMLVEADSNKDGQLSFLEWFEWLSPGSSTSDMMSPSEWSADSNGVLHGFVMKSIFVLCHYCFADPMVLALEDVLRQSVCTLRIVSRITDDPSVLCAGYVAGGIIAGVLDVTELAPWRPGDSKKVSVTRSMLARLSPSTRYRSTTHTHHTAQFIFKV